MIQPEQQDQARIRKVIALFFAGLLLMAVLEIVIGWACRNLGAFQLGWLNYSLGFPVAALGSGLVIWSVWVQYTLGEGAPAPAVATRRLVTQGPYAYTRNPMTLGALLFYMGIGLWIGSGVVIALVMVVFTALLTYIYVHETRELSERFGAEYEAYKNRTPFFWPHIR